MTDEPTRKNDLSRSIRIEAAAFAEVRKRLGKHTCQRLPAGLSEDELMEAYGGAVKEPLDEDQ